MTDQHIEPMGEVFTRRWVVDWMLDLAGYRADQPLHKLTLVEPSCGAGAFFLPVVERLIESCRQQEIHIGGAELSLLAVDLHAPSVSATRSDVTRLLIDKAGLEPDDAAELAAKWVRQADFLLSESIPEADVVVGNPPYVRLEDVPGDLAAKYRKQWTAMGGRADLYVGFYERGLSILAEGGRLAYICADRWMRNSYGRGLRELITEGPFAVDEIVRMHDVDCFEDEVSAYPAITILRRGEQRDGVVVDAHAGFGPEHVEPANQALASGQSEHDEFSVGVVDGWFGVEVWPEGTPEQLAQLADHEARHEPLEDVLRQTKVGIGVATGADKVFITEDPQLVEYERLLPLVMAKHIADGKLNWTPTYLVDPWDNDGVIDLDAYPRTKAYFESHKEQLAGRHVAKKGPARWHRTIDRVNHWLTDTPKILLADMKARMTPVVEPGGLYPHHNLYWITSTRWDIDVLAGLLLSDQAELFIRAYCVKMRGGTLRMQAQYVRRIRVPEPASLTEGEAEALRGAYSARDRKLATDVARSLYGRNP